MAIDIEEVLKAIVPLTFLAIWALTSLFSRDAKPQVGRPAQGLGPRPGGPGPAPPPRPGNPAMARDPAVRWGNPPGTETAIPRRIPGRPDEEILVIRSETGRAAGPPLPRPGAGAAAAKRTTRPKAAPTTAPKRAEPTAARPLSGSTASTPYQNLTQQLDIAPLSTQQATPGVTPQPQKPAYELPAKGPATPLSELRLLIGSRDRIREAILLNEVLQPPIAYRRGRRM
jgi:hypothetical protein